MICFFLIVIGIVAADFVTKYLACAFLKGGADIALINKVLYLSYTENRGAAFGMLKNQRWLFISVTVICVLFIIFYIVVKKPKSRILGISLAMIAGGGVGNLIDRISLQYVVDFIDFRIINFPVFNVADIFVSVGAVLMVIYILFFEGKDNGAVRNEK